MANRFGRNQKRKLKAELQEARDSAATYKIAAKVRGEALEEARAFILAWDRDICEVLGKYSGFLSAHGQKIVHEFLREHTVRPSSASATFNPDEPFGMVGRDSYTFHRLLYRMFYVDLPQMDLEKLAMHVRLVQINQQTNKKCVSAYDIDGQLIYTAKDKRVLADMVAKQIVNHMARAGNG